VSIEAGIRRSFRPTVVALAAVGVLLAAAGCTASNAPTDTEGGMGLPTVGWLTEEPQGGEAISGTLAIADNGCFSLATDDALLFALWPEGFEHGGAEVVTASGTRIGAGDEVEGTGVTLTVAEALQFSDGPDGRLGSALGYCSAESDVVVLSTVDSPE
jgi:hypothetical protein